MMHQYNLWHPQQHGHLCPRHRHPVQVRRPICASQPSTSELGSLPLVEECSIDNWRSPLKCDVVDMQGSAGIVVALGKFDAMHIGHRALATRASEGSKLPFLLSFYGMAEVLGLPVRQPLVASCDRPRVLQSWTQHCNGRVPRQRMIPFHEIRTMPPEAFVALLAHNLRAAGVVAGSNYRFGFKAAGTASTLQTLGTKYGMSVSIVDLVGPSGQGSVDGDEAAAGSACGAQDKQADRARSPTPTPGLTELGPHVSSSKVRQLLSEGSVQDVAPLLGRPYRLVAALPAPPLPQLPAPAQSQSSSTSNSTNGKPAASTSGSGAQSAGAASGSERQHSGGEHSWVEVPAGSGTVLLPSETLLNQAPAPGVYRAAVAVVARTGMAAKISRQDGSSGLEPLMLPSLLPWESAGAQLQGTLACITSITGSGNGSGGGQGAGSGSGPSMQGCCFMAVADVEVHAQGITVRSREALQVLQQLSILPSYMVVDFEARVG